MIGVQESGTRAAKSGAELLLDAAERLFLRRGYVNVSLQQIADEAGFTKGAAYYHFQSKEDIFLAVSQRILLSLIATVKTTFLREDHSVEDNLTDGMRALITSTHGDLSVWFSDATKILNPETLQKLLHETLGIDDLSQLLTPLFARAQHDGELQNVSPEAASRVFLKILIATVDEESQLQKLGTFPQNDVDGMVREIVTIFLYGASGKPLPDRTGA